MLNKAAFIWLKFNKKIHYFAEFSAGITSVLYPDFSVKRSSRNHSNKMYCVYMCMCVCVCVCVCGGGGGGAKLAYSKTKICNWWGYPRNDHVSFPPVRGRCFHLCITFFTSATVKSVIHLSRVWQDPNGWLTEWVSSVRIKRKTLTAFAVSILVGVCVKMSKFPFLGIVCAYVWLSMWHVCVKVVLVVCYFYVPLVHSACPFTLCMFLHWHGALQCAYGYWHVYLPFFISVCIT